MTGERYLLGLGAIGVVVFTLVVLGFASLTIGLAMDVKERGPTIPPELEADYRQVGYERGIDWALLAAWDGAETRFALPVRSKEEVYADLYQREVEQRRHNAEQLCADHPRDPAFCPPPPPIISPSDQEELMAEAYRIWHGAVLQHMRTHAEQIAAAVEFQASPERGFQRLLSPEQAGRAAELYEAYLVLDQMDQDDDHVAEVDQASVPADWHPVDGFAWPAVGPITSRFGMRVSPVDGKRRLHAGVDLGVGLGTLVRASKEGTVVRAERDDVFGFVVVIDHGGGYQTLYAHNSRLQVREGEVVRQGQVISQSGSTGWSTGPHLHFEIHYQGAPVDPLLLLGR